MGQITIKDVAREAGVSISTVSNALNDVDVLHPDTKAHVLEVAQRLHYVPNLNGRNLKVKATKNIGLFVNSMSGPYYGELADAIERVCAEKGYELSVFITQKSSTVMNNLFGKRVDGGIFLNAAIGPAQIETLQENQIPMVFLDREWSGEKTASVVFDSYGAGYLAAEYLLSLGINRIGFFQGITSMYDGRERERGFRAALEKAGVSLPEKWVWQGEFHTQRSRQAMERYLEKGKEDLPQGIFAANDQSAMGCIQALTAAGISVPKEVKVLGCDDLELSSWFRPSLSTILTNTAKQGTCAARKLLAMLEGEEVGEQIKISGKLVLRDSTNGVSE